MIEIAARTHVGRIRRHNQDAFFVNPDTGLIVLADGMGGHKGGDIAARLAVDYLGERVACDDVAGEYDVMKCLLQLGQAIEGANEAVYRYAEQNYGLEGMGTTLVVAVFHDKALYYGHVGDSRLYRLRSGRLRCLTHDHSMLQEMVDQGVFSSKREAREAGVPSNVLTRCLGVDPTVDADLHDAFVNVGDIYLACSDGLTGLVSDAELAHIIKEHQSDLEAAADGLLEAALREGGGDNITLVLARARA